MKTRLKVSHRYEFLKDKVTELWLGKIVIGRVVELRCYVKEHYEDYMGLPVVWKRNFSHHEASTDRGQVLRLDDGFEIDNGLSVIKARQMTALADFTEPEDAP